MISGCFLGGKNVDRILKLPVREIKLSECVETGRRLRRVRFDLVDVVQIGPFPPLPESPGHVHGHPQGGFVRHSLLFAGRVAFPGPPHQPCFTGPCTHEGVQNGKTSMRVSLGSSEQRYEST